MASDDTRVLRPRIEIPVESSEQDGVWHATTPLVEGVSGSGENAREAASALASAAEAAIAQAVTVGALARPLVSEPEREEREARSTQSERCTVRSETVTDAVEALFRRHHMALPTHVRRELVGVVRTVVEG